MYSFYDLYKKVHKHNLDNSEYIGNFLANPYSYLKARYYFLTANFIVYAIQNLDFNPRYLTFIYILQGFLAMILLNVENIYLNLLSLFLFFSKGTFDWADGHYARLKNKTSLTGHIIDIYGARLNSVFFLIGLGLFQYQKYYNDYFLYMLIFLPIFMFGYLEKYSYQIIFNKLNNIELDVNIDTDKTKKISSGFFGSINNYRHYFINFLDDRSRTVDLIILILFIELYSNINFSYIFFILIFIKWALIWFYSLIFHSSNNWSEKILIKKNREIKK